LEDGAYYFEIPDTVYYSFLVTQQWDGRLLYHPITPTGIKQGGIYGIPPMPAYYYGYLHCAYAIDQDGYLKFPFLSVLEKTVSRTTVQAFWLKTVIALKLFRR